MIHFVVSLPDLEDNESMDSVAEELETIIQEEYCADAVVKEQTSHANHPDSRP